MKPRILIVTDYYAPGFKGGGPIRTIGNLVKIIGGEFAFRIATMDRDLGDRVPYRGIPVDTWVDGHGCPVRYLSPSGQRLTSLATLVRDENPDLLYLNGLYSRLTVRSLFLRRAGALPRLPVILAPRGMLARGALLLKRWKKRSYIGASSLLGFYRGVLWHASDDHEAADILRHFPGADVHKAPPLAATRAERPIGGAEIPGDEEAIPTGMLRPAKRPGHARFVFLSRISKVKNLDGALEMLRGVPYDLSFDLFGPIEDAGYWKNCQDLIASLTPNLVVTYRGAVSHDRVGSVLSGHHFFFLPTLGENYGHIVFEALDAGLPVIISDKTPWRSLESLGVGWDIPLADRKRMTEIIGRCVSMGQEEYEGMSRKAREYAVRIRGDAARIEQNRELFRRALSGTRRN